MVKSYHIIVQEVLNFIIAPILFDQKKKYFTRWQPHPTLPLPLSLAACPFPTDTGSPVSSKVGKKKPYNNNNNNNNKTRYGTFPFHWIWIIYPLFRGYCINCTKYLWSCNQSVAWKSRHWKMLWPDIYILYKSWKKKPLLHNKFKNFEEYRSAIYIDVPVLLHSQYLGDCFQHFDCMHIWLLVFLPVSSTFFQFFPLSSGRNWKKYPFSSFFHSSRKKPISSASFRTLPSKVGWYFFSLKWPQKDDPTIVCSHLVAINGPEKS